MRDPHPISIPSKQLEDDAHAVAGAGDDALSYEPRKFLTVQSSSLDVSRDVELERLRDDYGRHERHQLPYEQNETTYLDKRTDARDITLNLGRRQLGPPHRGMPEDFQRSSNISSDAGRREQPLRPRALINDNGRRDSDYDRLKDEKPVDREGGFVRDVRPLDGSNVRVLFNRVPVLTPLNMVSRDAGGRSLDNLPASLERTMYRLAIDVR